MENDQSYIEDYRIETTAPMPTDKCPITGKDVSKSYIEIRLDPYHQPLRVCSHNCVRKVKHLHKIFMES